MHKIVFSLAVLGLSATAAMAQAPTDFADVDADGNGELSFAELQLIWPDLTEQEFSGADVDVSAGISTAELNSLQPAVVPAPPAEPAAPASTLPVEPAPSLSDPGPLSEAE